MNKQRETAKNKLNAGLNSAAAIFTQQPEITEEDNTSSNTESNNGIKPENNNGTHTSFNNNVTAEFRRGPKKKGDFKKVTLNLDSGLNLILDQYILTLKQEALMNGADAPNKSEWVRDVVEEKLRELGIME